MRDNENAIAHVKLAAQRIEQLDSSVAAAPLTRRSPQTVQGVSLLTTKKVVELTAFSLSE